MPRPRLSDELHNLKGTRYVDRKKAPEESQVIASRPRTPRHLSADALTAWKEAVRLLRKKGTLASSDAATLEIYAEVKASWLAAKKDVQEKGQVYDEQRFSKSGTPYTVRVENPSVKIQAQAERQLLALTKALGLAPTEREKVKQARPKNKNAPPKPGSIGDLHPELLIFPKEEDSDDEQQ